MKKIIILFFFVLGFQYLKASPDKPAHPSSPSTGETRLIASLNALQGSGDLYARDSIFDQYAQAQSAANQVVSEILYVHYFEPALFADKKKALRQAQNWAYACEKSHQTDDASRAYRNWSSVLLSFKDFELALGKAERALELAQRAKDKSNVAEARIARADAYEALNQKSSAFRDYLDAYYDALELKSDRLIQKSQSHISEFFVNCKLYGQALKYKKAQLDQFLKSPRRSDSDAYYSLLSQISDNYLDKGQIREGSEYAHRVLDYCMRHGNRSLLYKQLSVIRSNYFETNNFSGLLDLYGQRFPGELDSLKPSNPIAYYRIRSLQREQVGDRPGAAACLDSAARFLPVDKSGDFISANFFIRAGEFYLRNHLPARAIPYFEQAYDIAYAARYFPFLKTASRNLDTAYAAMGDFRKAHYFRGKTLDWSDSLRQLVDNDAIVLLEFESQEKQKELSEKQHQEQIDRKHNLQYMLIVILIATSFVVLIVLGSVRIPEIVIKSLGYLVFIFFFEFIILLADNKIHHMTHGEPLKIMGFKIVLIALLLPLHHWVEHKVVHYLLHHKILTRLGKHHKSAHPAPAANHP